MSRRLFFDASLIGVARRLALKDDRIIYPGTCEWPYPSSAPDEEWLPYIGERDWCAVLRDKRTRYRPRERAVLEEFRVRVVVIATLKNRNIEENVALLRRFWDGIEEALVGPPVYWHLTSSGLKPVIEYGKNP